MADNAFNRPRNALMDTAQGVSKGFWADGLGGPVDLMTTLANLGIAGGGYAGHKLGLLSKPPELISNPTGGSEWIAQQMRQRGLLNDNPGSTADNYGRVAGGLLAPLTQARAPQIANALQQAPEAIARAASPKYVAMGGGVTGRQGGAVNFEGPQSKALRIAQANAAKPIAEGGLGLHPHNTAAERAQAMGFDTELLHGTTNDFPAFSESTRHSTYATQDPKIADIYANAVGRHKALREINAGPNVIPLLGRGKLLETSDYRNGSGGWMQNNMADSLGVEPKRGLTKELPAYGYDGAKVTMDDLGGPQTQFIYPDPKVLRSRFAAFDPFLRNSSNLLAGVGAGGLGLSFLLDAQRGKD